MGNKKKFMDHLFPIVLLYLFLAASIHFGIAAGKDDQNQGILPPDSKIEGLTYGEWSAKWWQWAYSMPTDRNPLFDTAGCSQGQSREVWFLGSGFVSEQGPSGEITTKVNRKCTVPAGTFLFFPVINVEGSTIEGNGETERELKSYASGVMANVVDVKAEIDGQQIEKLDQYRISSPLFTLGPLPEDNVLQWLGFDAPGGTTTNSVGDGIYLMLEPLSVGKHTIKFGGTVRFAEDPDAPVFELFKQEVSYEITVEPN